MRLVPDPPGRTVGGEVIFEGHDLIKLSGEDMRRVRGKQISMVFQEPMTSLNPVLTVERQLTEALELHPGDEQEGVTKRSSASPGAGRYTRPGTARQQYPHQFSGGMRQRVMIAIALSCNPRLIIADEPTTALDVTIQAQILELMKNLSSEYGVSLIIITHNLGVVARYADRVNIMYAGKIIERGSAYDIYRNPSHPIPWVFSTRCPGWTSPGRRSWTPSRGSLQTWGIYRRVAPSAIDADTPSTDAPLSHHRWRPSMMATCRLVT